MHSLVKKLDTKNECTLPLRLVHQCGLNYTLFLSSIILYIIKYMCVLSGYADCHLLLFLHSISCPLTLHLTPINALVITILNTRKLLTAQQCRPSQCPSSFRILFSKYLEHLLEKVIFKQISLKLISFYI